MSSVPIVELGQVLNPAPGRKLITVLQASLDASWDQPIGITAVAGYIATLGEWRKVEGAWAEGLAEWKIPYFHLRELRKWMRAERVDPCVRYFSQIIECSGLCAVGSALRDMDWDAPDWNHMTTQRLESRYKQCLDMSLDVLGDFSMECLASEPVSVLFDSDGANKYIEEAFNNKQSKYSHFVQFAVRSVKIPSAWPLQCADLGAGLLRRSWGSIEKHPKYDRRPWGDMPKGADTRSRLSFWSLRQGDVLNRAIRLTLDQSED